MIVCQYITPDAMTHNVLGKNLTAREQRGFTTYLQKKFHRIEELLTGIPTDAVHLHATCERFPSKAAYKVSLDLRVKGKRNFVYEDSHGIHEATDLAVDKLIAQMKHQSTKRQGAQRKSRATRRALKEAGAAPAADDEPDQSKLFQELQPLLPKLRTSLERELRSLELTGQLAAGQLTADAVIDALVIDTYDHVESRTKDLPFATWVDQRARYLLRTMAREIQEENDSTVSLERPIASEDIGLSVSELGEEQLEFYQPDDLLLREDALDLSGQR